MKNLATILSVLSLVGVLVLFGLHFSGGEKKATKVSGGINSTAPTGNARIAYVDIDSFQEHYDYLKSTQEDFKKRQEAIENELAQSAKKLQNDAADFQRKAQSGSMTQAEAEAAQKRLLQMDQSLRLREQTLSDQLLKEKEAFNEKYQKSLTDFLEEYNKDKNYDYIFSYSASMPLILHADKAYNITDDVIKGMNERAKKIPENTAKKK